MKRNKLGILTMIALGGLMVCGPAAFAQDKPATPPPPAADAPPAPRGRNAGIQGVLAQLDLTSDQKEKVKPIMADYREKMTALRESNPSQEDRRSKMKEINEGVDAKMKDVLTADQFTKYQDLRKQMGRGRRNGGGTPPPAPDAPKADKN